MSQEVSLPELVRQVGLEELATIGKEELAKDFMPAAVTGLADGDLVTMHQPYTGRQAELYGENHFGDGKVAQTIGRAAIENGMAPGNLYEFQGFAAEYFTTPGSPLSSFKTESSVRVYPEAVTIDGNPLALARTPSLVIDYGACLTGRSYIADQMAFPNRGQRPFTYVPLTRTHFMNQTLANTYDANYGPGTARAVIANQLYIGREDGVTGTTDEIIRAHNGLNLPTEVADVILCTGAQHAAPEDLQRGITNAHKLLKEGGMLVVRSLARPAADELGTEEIAGWAFDAGFIDRNVVRYEAALESAGSLLLTGHFGEREIQTLVLTK
jgi:SAM-dependent methyltransferase